MKNYDVQKFFEWPLFVQAIMIGVISLGLLYLGYFFDISSLQSRIVFAESQEDDLKQQFSLNLQKQIPMMNNVASLPLLKQTLSTWEGKIIHETQLQALQDTILKLGEENHLKFTEFTPGPPVKVGTYVRVPIKIDILGSYDQIGSFISQVANLQTLVVVGNFMVIRPSMDSTHPNDTIVPLNSDVPLSAEVNLEIYRR